MTGTVVSDQGRSIADATVCWEAHREVLPPPCIRTDASGQFQLEVTRDRSNGTVLATASGYAPGRLPLAGQDSDHDLTLVLHPGGAQLSGRVLDIDGAPICGARVTARALNSDEGPMVALSDFDGGFSLGVTAGSHRLEAVAEMYSRTTLDVDAPARGLELLLAPAATIWGRVTEADGVTPVPGATVLAINEDGLRGPERSVTTDGDGAFEHGSLPPGTYLLGASAPRRRTRPLRVGIGVGESTGPVTLVALPSVMVTASVRANDRSCLAGKVTFAGPEEFTGPISDGSVKTAAILPGRYIVTLHCAQIDGYSRRAHGQETLDVEDNDVSLEWNLQLEEESKDRGGTGTIEVVVREADPDEFLRVLARRDHETSFTAIRAADREGRFVLEQLPLGGYDVFVEQALQVRRQVTLDSPGQTAQISLELPRSAAISGRVLDEQGQPAPDTWVRAVPSGTLEGTSQRPTPVMSDDDGQFRIPGLRSESYTLLVESGRGRARLDDVAPGRSDLIVRVREFGHLSGSVGDASGVPVGSFTLYVREARVREVQEVIGGDGHWPPLWLSSGEYVVAAVSSEGSAIARATVNPGMHTELNLTVAEHTPIRVADLYLVDDLTF